MLSAKHIAATAAATAAAETAIALATKTAQTAEALASAKVASDMALALVGADIGYIKVDIKEIKDSLKEITSRDDSYVLKEDFVFWRNLLVSGLLVSLLIGVILNLLKINPYLYGRTRNRITSERSRSSAR